MDQLFPQGLGKRKLMKIPTMFAVGCKDSCSCLAWMKLAFFTQAVLGVPQAGQQGT